MCRDGPCPTRQMTSAHWMMCTHPERCAYPEGNVAVPAGITSCRLTPIELVCYNESQTATRPTAPRTTAAVCPYPMRGVRNRDDN